MINKNIQGSYKIGEVAIWRMRRKAEATLGEKFNIRQFHTCLLDSGPMPLDTLADKVDAWIQRKLEEN